MEKTMYGKRKERDEEAKGEDEATVTDPPVPNKETAPSKKHRGSVREEGDDMLLLLAKTRVEELAPTQKGTDLTSSLFLSLSLPPCSVKRTLFYLFFVVGGP
jgi:hypothetical protein